MNALQEFLVFILTAYLSFTNTLAHSIESILPGNEPAPAMEESIEDEESLSLLPSIFGTSIPDILLRNAEFQQAALSSAGLSGSNTTDPLDALVNVFCTFTTPDYIRTTTGSGFFIDPDGILMTNAHIAQFLLLEKTDTFGDAECIIRTGSPAQAEYEAELLYISPAWVQENASTFTDAVPMGTGERDYALLYVSDSVDNEPLPAVFPALAVDSQLLPVSSKESSVTAAGYPATDLIRNGADTDLLARKADTTISELYTFGSNYADVFSMRGTEVGAEGSSGGPIVNEAGEVIGLIATRGDDAVDGAGSLRAITMSHINRTIEQETGFTLEENLNGNLTLRARIFSETLAPFLIQIIEQGSR